MKKILTIPALALLAFVLACTTPEAVSNVALATPAPTVAPKDEAPRIDLAGAKKDFDDGNAIFIDARPEDSYRDEHVKGAINVTFDTLDKELKRLPKGKTIIAYCS